MNLTIETIDFTTASKEEIAEETTRLSELYWKLYRQGKDVEAKEVNDILGILENPLLFQIIYKTKKSVVDEDDAESDEGCVAKALEEIENLG